MKNFFRLGVRLINNFIIDIIMKLWFSFNDLLYLISEIDGRFEYFFNFFMICLKSHLALWCWFMSIDKEYYHYYYFLLYYFIYNKKYKLLIYFKYIYFRISIFLCISIFYLFFFIIIKNFFYYYNFNLKFNKSIK